MHYFRLLLWLTATHLYAWSFYGNQSHIQWKSAETAHFVFVYPAEYQEAVNELASFAEAVHDSVVQRYRIQLPNKSTVILRNSLFSNGQASPLANTMNTWITDWDFKVRSTHRWIYDVFTHEFSHLVSMQTGTKLAPWIHSLQITHESYANSPVASDVAVQFPLAIFPMWLAEGTAQYESARMGYDAWDSHRDMLLRVAALHDSLLPLDAMRAFRMQGLQAEQGPYNQGFSLVRYLVKRFGPDVLSRLWSEMSRMHRMTFSAACQAVTGFTEEELYAQWKVEIEAHYQNQMAQLGPLRQGIKRTQSAFWQDHLHSDGEHLWGISNFGSPWFDGALFKLPNLDSLPASQKPDSLGQLEISHFAEKNHFLTKPWLEKGFSVRGDLVAFVGYSHRDRNGQAYFDIFVDDSSASPWLGDRKSLRSVTRFANAIYPDLSPDTQQVVFVRREAQGSRFILSVAPVPSVGSPSEEARDLLVPPAQAHSFNLYTPRWSPDGKWIAFSLYDGISRKIAIIDAQGQQFQILTPDSSDNRDPSWSLDGQKLYFSSNRSGIFNIWALSAQNFNLAPQAITNVEGGAFTPQEWQGNLWYTGYDVNGFSLYEIPKSDTTYPQLKVQTAEPLSPVVSVGSMELQGVSKAYSPLPTQPILVPLLSFGEQADARGNLRDSRTVAKAGAALGLTDPLQKNVLQVALLLELGKGVDYLNQRGLNPAYASDLFALWENRSFPLTFDLGYVRRNLTSEDTVHYEDPRSHHDSLFAFSPYAITVQALQGAAGYSPFKKGDSIVVGVSSQWARFDLYQDGFFWDYLRSQALSSTLSWSQSVEDNFSGITGPATGVALTWQWSQSDLYRPGTFQESFTISSEGIVSPKYRNYQLHEAWLAANWALPIPFHAGAQLTVQGQMSGILAWQGTNLGQDTLDHYFHHGTHLAGYPLLSDDETLESRGEKTAQAELHYALPLYSELGANLWIFTAQDAYLDLFAQAGLSWSDSSLWQQVRQSEMRKRSLGFELRFQNSIFMNQPLSAYFQCARALDPLANQQNADRISVPLVPSFLEPTGIRMGIGYSFGGAYNAHP